MATLPSQGGSEGTWGTELNAVITTEHTSTGTHDSVVFMATLSSQMIMNNDNVISNNNELIFI